MEIEIDGKTGNYSIVNLTLEQVKHILNCIIFAQERGAEMPK